MKNIYFVALAIVVLIYMLMSIRKNSLGVKTSFGWIIGALIILFLSIWPKSIDWFAIMLGIDYPPALFLTLCVVFLFVVDFRFSKKIQEQQEKITDLAQELTDAMYTLPIALNNLSGQFNTDWGVFSAASLVTAVPVIILFISLSKFMVSGLTLGGVKG